jgi:8-oxo-dGTP pyrophosphatase MutT (NUDIX family)
MTGAQSVTSDDRADRRIKRSVAVVIRDFQDPTRVLLVQRPPDDEDLPLAWGLPAASLRDGESWGDAVARAAREKLGLRVEPGVLLNEGKSTRRVYMLHMRLYEAELVEGTPRLDLDSNEGTRYVDWTWGAPELLEPAAQRGSLCSRLFLDTL